VSGEERDCTKVFGAHMICVGDLVEIYPRGLKSMIAVRGKVLALSDSAIVISRAQENHWIIRYSEIRMIRVLKPEDKPQ